MTNKELNMAILSKLYEIAEMIWQKMVRNDHGCFRASEIAKNMGKIFYWGDADEYELIQIEVGSFRCEFAAAHIFRLVTKFEGIAGIGKNAHMFTYQEEDSKERGCVCFQATKEMAELCDFTYKKHDMKAITSIFIDAEKNRLVATDSHKLLAMPVTITQKSGDTREMLINAKTWKKMCAKMKLGKVYDLVAVKLDNREEATVIEFDGMTSYEPSPCRFVDWTSCFGNIFDGYCVRIGSSWDAIRKMIYSVSGEDYVSLSGRKGENDITVKKGENVATFATDEVLKHSFSLSFDTEHLLSIPQLDILYLGVNEKTLKMAESENGNVYLLCPRKDGDSYIGEKVADGGYDAGEPGKGVKLLQKTCEITAPAVAVKKVSLSSEKKKKSVDDSRKFTFEAVGIEPGDIITFIHGGQRVITIDNNKVVYQGKVYTLSGFCKEFMPDDRRNKANSYRGCAFFAYKGVKLDKMFKEALKAKEHADLTQDKEEEEKEIKHLSVPAAIIKMNIAELLASPSYTRDFKPVCGYFASSSIIVPFGRDKDVGARKNHYLVGVAAQPMPPPGNEKKFLPLQARGARL
jgi:hypothetical protein|nr:MAG TPA: DNA polymerase III beta subunit, central domain [Caudoviricetes sp.]